MPDFQLITKAMPPMPFIRAVMVRTPKCPCLPMMVRHEVQMVTNITSTCLWKAISAMRANQLSLESKLTIHGIQEQPLFSLWVKPSFPGHCA